MNRSDLATACAWLSIFFFSSRRRHTRLQGDWSSDVCSSDLVAVGHAAGTVEQGIANRITNAPARRAEPRILLLHQRNRGPRASKDARLLVGLDRKSVV